MTQEAKQLILKNITSIRPIPNEYILKAMDECYSLGLAEGEKERERLKNLLEKYYKSQWHPDNEIHADKAWEIFTRQNQL